MTAGTPFACEGVVSFRLRTDSNAVSRRNLSLAGGKKLPLLLLEGRYWLVSARCCPLWIIRVPLVLQKTSLSFLFFFFGSHFSSFFCSTTRCFCPTAETAGRLLAHLADTSSNSGVKTESVLKKITKEFIIFSQKRNNQFYLLLLSSLSGYSKQVTFFSLVFLEIFSLHLQIIWAKVYYLFYNISSKIFAFLLLPTDCF